MEPPTRRRYFWVGVACIGLLGAIVVTLMEPFHGTRGEFAGRLVSPISLIMLGLAPISRGTTQRVLIGAGLVLGFSGLALILAGHSG